MSEGERTAFCHGLACGLIISCIPISIGAYISTTFQKQWQKEAIEHRAAEYDSQTGNWHWIEQPAEQSK